jgi:hypothetical protein
VATCCESDDEASGSSPTGLIGWFILVLVLFWFVLVGYREYACTLTAFSAHLII